ncbi:MAG: MerR family transcriptional regulator [Bacteroidetes bacterium]|nr:MerR family transcriptional regulator [Bacteroidota bacterium]
MQKLYHSISEVSELVDEEQHILRYWEKEFNQLKPKKNRGGNRIYSDKDLILLKLIKKYLRTDKLSLKGAKEQLDKYLTLGQEATLFGQIPQSGNDFDSEAQRKAKKIGQGAMYVKSSELTELYNTLKEASEILKA